MFGRVEKRVCETCAPLGDEARCTFAALTAISLISVWLLAPVLAYLLQWGFDYGEPDDNIGKGTFVTGPSLSVHD